MDSHVLIVVPPISPSDTNVPLGPGILRPSLREAGIEVRLLDLAIAFLHRFGTCGPASTGRLVGDQDKDRALTHSAREAYLALFPKDTATACVPDCVDPRLGMCFSFEALHAAVEKAAAASHPFGQFLRSELGRCDQPALLGISIMGAPQVLFALMVSIVARELWPDTRIVAGGSHVTILQREIAGAAEYGRYVDAFLPHHCEAAFAALLKGFGKNELDFRRPGVVVAGEGGAVSATGGQFNYLPEFEDRDLAAYGGKAATIPLQFTRSCPKNCPYCSYRAAEPPLPGDPQQHCDVSRALDAIEHFSRRGYTRFSFKDSLFLQPALVAVAKGLLARGIEAKWSATTLLTPGLLKEAELLCRSGLQTLEFGVETIHAHVQRTIGKSIPPLTTALVSERFTQLGAGVVLNMIYGFPGESLDDAMGQVRWFQDLQERCGTLLVGSHNLLEVNRGAPFAGRAGSQAGIKLSGIAPWAFSFVWNAPAWRENFQSVLHATLGEVCHA